MPRVVPSAPTALGYGFAVIAAGVSAAYAWRLAEMSGLEPVMTWALKIVLVGLSILAVFSERGLINWARAARANADRSGAWMARALLTVAFVYTASMQLGFFADLLLRPMSRDVAATSSIADIDKKIGEIEQRRAWQPKSPGTSAAIARQVKDLENDRKAAPDGKSKRDLATRITQVRSDLTVAETIEKLDQDLGEARRDKSKALGRGPEDGKGAVLGKLMGLIGGGGEWFNYGLVLLAVGLLQLGQTVLPVVAASAYAKASDATPPPAPATAIDAPPPLPVPPAVDEIEDLAPATAPKHKPRKVQRREREVAERPRLVAASGGLRSRIR